MNCEMPGCDNTSVKKVSKTGIYSGVNLGHFEIHLCGCHAVEDVQDHIEEICRHKACGLQHVNPFMDIKIHKNMC